ncbi:hypothetical protein L3Q82_015664 [Scortum barcoo]|uniref:Uncharacterized protein n=1 Tax=Scortum barcoo TaxID=214431 RepID=A0ACB8VNE6_9TELE|nr:hypothetical protein L3Q82_015664 [Scortum barcoo]
MTSLEFRLRCHGDPTHAEVVLYCNGKPPKLSRVESSRGEPSRVDCHQTPAPKFKAGTDGLAFRDLPLQVDSRKLASRHIGPYEIERIINPNAVKLKVRLKHLRNTFSPKIALLDGINWASRHHCKEPRHFNLIRICPSTPILSIFQEKLNEMPPFSHKIQKTLSGKKKKPEEEPQMRDPSVPGTDRCAIDATSPHIDQPFMLQVDANDVGAGALLLQSDRNGVEYPIDINIISVLTDEELGQYISPSQGCSCCKSHQTPAALVTLDNLKPITGPRGSDVSFKYLPYQLSMVLSVPTMVSTGNGESGFDSGDSYCATRAARSNEWRFLSFEK